MATSMITGGVTDLDVFKRIAAMGMDHFHLSSHAIGEDLDKIVRVEGSGAKQAAFVEWMVAEGIPYRTNTSMQRLNFRKLKEITQWHIDHGVFHHVLLGFLPHYEWSEHLLDVAVHPADMRYYIENALRACLDSDTYVTLRYHPLCHLSPEFWPYVTNARHVLMDPWEWNYSLNITDVDKLWIDSVALGEAVACQTPCNECLAYRHCGGWNKKYADGYEGAELQPITTVPEQFADVWETEGGLHDLNPVNALTGTIRKRNT
jgi:MoaA/NifB/PqqE/SkfB family radical SAM enzyme